MATTSSPNWNKSSYVTILPPSLIYCQRAHSPLLKAITHNFSLIALMFRHCITNKSQYSNENVFCFKGKIGKNRAFSVFNVIIFRLSVSKNDVGFKMYYAERKHILKNIKS